MNLQNTPRPSGNPMDIRNMYVASDGFYFIEADYSQAELRVLTHLSGDVFLTSIYMDGRDLHNEMSLELYGPAYTKEQRVRAKAVNFGIPYGRGPDSIAREHKIPFAEAQDIIRKWLRRAPEAAEYLNRCRQAPLMRRTLVTPTGRRRRFALATREALNALQNEASNFPISSTSSDLTLHSGMRIQERFDKVWGSANARVVNLVHDSILAEVHESIPIEIAAPLMIGIMERVPAELIGATIPFTADVKTGTVWGSLKEWPQPSGSSS